MKTETLTEDPIQDDPIEEDPIQEDPIHADPIHADPIHESDNGMNKMMNTPCTILLMRFLLCMLLSQIRNLKDENRKLQTENKDLKMKHLSPK